MKKYIFLIALFYPAFIWAQQGRQITDPVINHQFGYLNQMPLKPAGITGSVYLNEQWKTATLNLKSGVLSVSQLAEVLVKLDLKSNTFELLNGADIKILDGNKVESFSLVDDVHPTDEVFVNCDKFFFEGTKLIGFGRLIHKGDKLSLIQHVYVEFIQADYNVALDVGSRDHKYVKRDKLYFVKDDQMIPVNKQSISNTMSDKGTQIKKYVKEYHVNIKQEGDLAKLVAYYNSI